MSQKPIFVVTHPRACSTAFERVFMTQRDTIQCVHEPFGDAFYYGPERLSARFADDEQGRQDSGFSESTFKTVLDRIEREASEDENKRIFIKDIIHYLLPPDGKPASIAPSLKRLKRGVGTDGPINGVNGSANGTNGHTNGVNGHAGKVANGVTNGSSHHATVNGSAANGDANGHAASANPTVANGTSNGVQKTTMKKQQQREPYPYDTAAEPGNPTVMPQEILSQFHFVFLIRDPHYSVPSYYRCTIPPLDDVTGFYNYDPLEAGYDEVRRTLDYLRSVRLVGPHVATREHQDVEDVVAGGDRPQPVVNGDTAVGDEICVVDADDMLDKPAPMIEAFCRSVGIEYKPSMLEWDTKEDHQHARDAFEKWRGFHNDAIESKGLMARKHARAKKTEEEFDAEWRQKYGDEGAAIIRNAVDRNMADYLYLKKFAMVV